MTTSWFDRTMSAFPLSIGTSLAFESIFEGRQPPFDAQREIPQKIRLSDYQVFYLNLETLIRNLFGSVDKDFYLKINPNDAADILAEEIEVIKDILKNEGRDTTKGIFYVHQFDQFLRLKNNQFVLLRKATTDLQRYSEKLVKDTLDVYLRKYRDDSFIRIFKNDLNPKGHPTGLLLSHVPYDLTSAPHFRSLDLLESHTGKLKKKSSFYTKLFKLGGEDMSFIPLSKRTLYIFGDHVTFSPWKTKVRHMVFEIARQHNWSFMTTDEKILLNFDISLKDRYLFDAIRQLPC